MDSRSLSDKEEVEDLTKEFIAESEEGLDRMERCLTTLELRPDDPELLGEIFRAVHSIKGATGFLGFERLEALAHVGESLLGLVRDGQVAVTGELISGLLCLQDGLRRILSLIDETGSEGRRTEDKDCELIEMLLRLCAPSQELAETRSPIRPIQMGAPGPKDRPLVTQPTTTVKGSSLHEAAETGQDKHDVEAQTHAAVEFGVGSERTLRVDVDVLNRMMNLVGELVLTRNQILQSGLDAAGFEQAGRRLNAVTTDLRETVMQARMQPVGNVFTKFPRLVRDLAQTCGKKVRIEFAGQETGLDKSLLEAIKDPVTHAVRNAIDHGIEHPRERLAAGKPEEGVLRLRAFHQGGAVVIEITDDGAGIAVERVRAKAMQMKPSTRERIAAMPDKEVLQMVFLPGFSTAEEVTNVSGRGVGMDVVRSNVERVGGSVELETRPGSGTTLRLRVPLTLAIVPALVVMSGGQSFALPQSTLIELIYVGRDEVDGAIERIGGTELYRLRGRLLPLVRLDRLLGIGCAVPDREARADGHKGFYLAVLEVDGCRFGLMLDDLLAPEEIVVKPLSRVLREIGVFSGATVLGNGTLALILDVAAVAARAGVSSMTGVGSKEQSLEETTGGADESRRFLLFRRGKAADAETMAIALERVERIESVEVRKVEFVEGRPVLQYRSQPLLLEDSAAMLRSASEAVTVLICQRVDGPGKVGLVVAEVFQVVSGTLLPAADRGSGAPVALLDGKLTAVVQPRFVQRDRTGMWETLGEVA